jgi:hypothetical protein
MRPAGRGVEHRIEIAAPAEAVWALVTDLPGWAAWNPLYVEGSGTVQVGQELRMLVAIEGMKPNRAVARVVTARPPDLLEYGMSNLGGLLRAFRYVQIERLGPDRCAVANGEIMSGPAGLLVARLIGEKVRRGLQRMNEALKMRAEAGRT